MPALKRSTVPPLAPVLVTDAIQMGTNCRHQFQSGIITYLSVAPVKPLWYLCAVQTKRLDTDTAR